MENLQQSNIIITPKYQFDQVTYPSNDITKKVVAVLIEKEAAQGMEQSKKGTKVVDLTQQDHAINELVQNLSLIRFEDCLDAFWGKGKDMDFFKLKFLDMFINCKELSQAASQKDQTFQLFEAVIKSCFLGQQDEDSIALDDAFAIETRKKGIPDETYIAYGKAQYDELKKIVGDQPTLEKIMAGMQRMYPHLLKDTPQLSIPDGLPPIPTSHQLQNSSSKEQNDLLRNASAEQLDEIRKMYYHPEMDKIVNLIEAGSWEDLLEQYKHRPEADSIILAAFVQEKIENTEDLATALMFLAVAAGGKRYTLHPIEHERCSYEDRNKKNVVHFQFVEKGRKVEGYQYKDQRIEQSVPHWIETNDIPKNQRYLITAHGSSLPEDLLHFLNVFFGGHLYQKESDCYTMPSFALMQQQVSQYLDDEDEPINSTARLVPMLGLSKRADMIDQIGRDESPFMLTTRQSPVIFLHGMPSISVWPYFHDQYHTWVRAACGTYSNPSALSLAKKIEGVLNELPKYSKPLIDEGAQIPWLAKDSTDIEGDLTRWLLDGAAGVIVDGSVTNDLDAILEQLSDLTLEHIIGSYTHKEKVIAKSLPWPNADTFEQCVTRAKKLLESH